MRIQALLAATALCFAGAAAAMAQPAAADSAAALKTGKELFEKSCRLCHGLDRALGQSQQSADWGKIIKRMVAYGAPLNAAQRPLVVRYLVARATFTGKCGSCHEATRVVGDEPGPRDWNALTARMAGHLRDLERAGKAPAGAVFAPGELEEIAALLQALLP